MFSPFRGVRKRKVVEEWEKVTITEYTHNISGNAEFQVISLLKRNKFNNFYCLQLTTIKDCWPNTLWKFTSGGSSGPSITGVEIC